MRLRTEKLPVVSVVVTCFNYAHFLERAISSVVDQTFDSWELLVVDDGSTDESSAIALDFATSHPNRDIKVLRAHNGGCSRARNLGISIARGRYVSCLDADDWYDPRAIENMAAILDSSPGTAVSSPQMRLNGLLNSVHNWPPYDFTLLVARNLISTCSMFRREEWERVGGFDESLLGYEDWEFWISIGELGADMAQIVEPLWNYRVSSDGKLASYDRPHDLRLRAHIVRNHPNIYGADSVAMAERILVGEDVDDSLLKSPHPIFAGSYRARELHRTAFAENPEYARIRRILVKEKRS